MRKSIAAGIAATLLASGLSIATPPAATARTDEPVAEPAPAAKVTRTFKRLTWRDKRVSWWDGEAVKVAPDGGGLVVRVQIKKGTRWVTISQQRTLATGVYDFGTTSRKKLRALRTRHYDVRIPDRYYSRVVVPGDAGHERLVSPSWYTSWG
jgi:hypothetical protein